MTRDNQPEIITLAHGNGGLLTHSLIEQVFVPCFDNHILAERADAARISLSSFHCAFTTDSYVVRPLIFPGGDIGSLAVAGTVNDLAVMGAQPVFLSAAFIIEEGFAMNTLKQIAQSMADTAKQAGVAIVTGDTKVVEKGKADGLYINTSGIGYFTDDQHPLSLDQVKPGDAVVLSGSIGDHGVAILAARKDFPVSVPLESDCAPLNKLITRILSLLSPGAIRMMRDPTRGGIGTTLNEFTQGRSFGIALDESAIPVKNEVAAICEMTGYDPLYIANEGKLLIIASGNTGDELVSILRHDPLGRDAAIIGRVTGKNPGRVVMKTRIGGERIIDMLSQDMFPRIC